PPRTERNREHCLRPCSLASSTALVISSMNRGRHSLDDVLLAVDNVDRFAGPQTDWWSGQICLIFTPRNKSTPVETASPFLKNLQKKFCIRFQNSFGRRCAPGGGRHWKSSPHPLGRLSRQFFVIPRCR